jgi:hypothetical protein
MQTLTIDAENNITVHAGLPAGTDESQSFTSQKELAKITANWPASRLVETWNSFAGVAPFHDLKPVKKFTSRSAAIARIWKAVQRLLIAQPAADVALVAGKRKTSPTKSKKRDTARPVAKKTATSKQADILAMMRRPKGAALASIMEATGWQAHTVRGFVSAVVIKKLGLKVESFRTEDKERAYRIIG